MIPIPSNLPLFINVKDEYARATIARIFNGQEDPATNIVELGHAFHVRIKFKQPTRIRIPKRWVATGDGWKTSTYYKEVTENIFRGGFFLSGGVLCYHMRRHARRGYVLPSVGQIESYEPVKLRW
jgi:hypothetical protein